MEAQLTAAFKESDPYKRLIMEAEALSVMNSENAPGAALAVQKSSLQVGRGETDPVVARWIVLDTPAAIEWALSTTGSLGRDTASQAIFSWVSQDGGGAAALEYLRTIPPAEEKYRIVRNNIIQGVGAGGDAAIATQLLSEMPDDETRSFLTMRLSLEFLRQDPELAKVWVLSIPDDADNGLKATAFNQVLQLLAIYDPASTAAWLDSLGLVPYVDEDTEYSVAQTYVLRDPSAGFEWLLSRPPSDGRDKAVRDAAYLLLKRNPQEAFPYLRANAATEGMQSAIFALSHYYASALPLESLEWALRVPKPHERDKAIWLPLKALAQRDIETATGWLDEHAALVSDDIRKKFRDQFAPKKKINIRGS